MAQKNLQVVGNHIYFCCGVHGRVFGSPVLSLLANKISLTSVWHNADGGSGWW